MYIGEILVSRYKCGVIHDVIVSLVCPRENGISGIVHAGSITKWEVGEIRNGR